MLHSQFYVNEHNTLSAAIGIPGTSSTPHLPWIRGPWQPLTSSASTGASSAFSRSSSESSDTSMKSASGLSSEGRLSRHNQRLLLLYSSRKQEERRSTSSDPRGYNIPSESRTCPICLKSNCRLRTHKQYARRSEVVKSEVARNAIDVCTLLLKQPSSGGCIDTFITLPISDATGETQQLFRMFLNSQSTNLADPVRARSFDKEYHPILFRQAMSDVALCHSCVAMAATYSAIHGRALQAPDSKLLAIYGRTFRALRQAFEEERNTPSDNTIMAAINLLMCHGIGFGDKDVIAAHPAALKNLVYVCGGVSNVSAQVSALLLWTDFYVSLYTDQQPMFLGQVGIMPNVPLTNPPPVVYGKAFTHLCKEDVISETLLEVCETTCRLTELLEDKVQGRSTPSRWQYFSYRRNTIPMRSGLVHSQLAKSATIAECVILVNHLLLFLVLRLMPWKRPIINVCDKLRAAIEASQWYRHRNVLIWILFVLLAVDEWMGKEWALRLLLETLTKSYNSNRKLSWPPNWREMQRLNLVNHAWSDVYMTEAFKRTCRNLGYLSRAKEIKEEISD